MQSRRIFVRISDLVIAKNLQSFVSLVLFTGNSQISSSRELFLSCGIKVLVRSRVICCASLLRALFITTEIGRPATFLQTFFLSVSGEHHQDDLHKEQSKAEGSYSWLRYGRIGHCAPSPPRSTSAVFCDCL